MIPAEIIADMASLGLSSEQARKVAEMLRAVEVATQQESASALNARRANDRERKARQREREDVKSRDIKDDVKASEVDEHSDSHVTSRDVTAIPVTSVTGSEADPSRARVLCGEEVYIYPLENATHSIPQGGNRSEAIPRNPRQRASRLAEGFAPTAAMRNYARRHGFSDAEIDAQGEAMRDWSMSSPGGAKLDWEATWRGWIRRLAERRPTVATGPPRQANPRLSPMMNAYVELYNECANADDETTAEPPRADVGIAGVVPFRGAGGAR